MSTSSDSFAHLHVHTEYSMLDGAAKISDLVDEVARQEMPAVAMTDHGVMFGAYEFWKKATAAGVNPIIGIEAYLTPGTARTEKTRVKWGQGGEDDVSGAGAYTHLTLVAENTEGMHNLFRMSSLASLEGYYFKPRMDRDLLQTYASGVIATTGCPSGEVQTRLRLGQYDEAVKLLRNSATSSGLKTTLSRSWITAWVEKAGHVGPGADFPGLGYSSPGHERPALHHLG